MCHPALMEIPRDRILLLSSEDMSRHLEPFWLKIAATMGIKAPHKRLEEFAFARFNTQAAKGFEGKSGIVADSLLGKYEISGFRPMFNSTRSFLGLCWKVDCQWIIRTFPDAFHHNYSACWE